MTLHQPPPDAPSRAHQLLGSPSYPEPGPARQACVGHAFLDGGPCHDQLTGQCLLRLRRRTRLAVEYLNAAAWRRAHIPVGYRNLAVAEATAHTWLCGPDACTCPPGYAEWFADQMDHVSNLAELAFTRGPAHVTHLDRAARPRLHVPAH